MKGLRLALGTLTIIPVGELGTLDRRDGRQAMLLAPLAALPLAAVTALLVWISRVLDLPPFVVGGLAVGVLAYGSRAMHLDGLADTVDGFGAGWNRERAIEVMKSGDVGPMGVAAMIVLLGIQVGCIGALASHPVLIGVLVMVSRGACTLLAATWWPPARATGMGSIMSGAVPGIAAMLSGLLLAIVTIAFATCAGRPLWAAVSGVIAAALSTWVLAHRSTKVFGGISGDIYGAGIEIAFTVLLLGLCAGGAL